MAKKNKVVHQKESVTGSKYPKSIEDPEGYLKKHPVWAFNRCDKTHERWAIKQCKCIHEEIIDKLISYEGQTWAEIQAASGGKSVGNGTNSHFENISDFIKEAQKRATELHLDVDQLFSLRLTGKTRLYGILDNGVFFIIWYDANHEIYPTRR